MSSADEELQNKIENRISVASSADARAYQKVFESLQQDPYKVPAHFADGVMQRISVREKSFSKDYIWIAIGLFVLMAATIATAFLTNFSIKFGAFKFISGYGGLFVLLVVTMLLFNWIDKRFIQRKYNVATSL